MGVIKKKRGKNNYYYLKYSYRKGNNVVTKEKYLGTKIPEDIDKIKSEFNKELNKPIYHKFNKIKKNFQNEWKRLPKTVKEKELEEIAITFTYNTNAIEGSTISLSETKEIIQDKRAPSKSLDDIKETELHSKVFLDALKNKERITNALLLKWHNDIFKETKQDISGKYRDYLIRVGSYVAPDWQDVKKLMKDLIGFCNDDMDTVELAARIHYRFEKIHPFGDGNGRIGRLLMNYILWWNKYPMLIIEYKGRESYYKALQKDEEGFVKYFFRRYLKVHEKRI